MFEETSAVVLTFTAMDGVHTEVKTTVKDIYNGRLALVCDTDGAIIHTLKVCGLKLNK